MSNLKYITPTRFGGCIILETKGVNHEKNGRFLTGVYFPQEKIKIKTR